MGSFWSNLVFPHLRCGKIRLDQKTTHHSQHNSFFELCAKFGRVIIKFLEPPAFFEPDALTFDRKTLIFDVTFATKMPVKVFSGTPSYD